MYRLIIGEISDPRKKHWDCNDKRCDKVLKNSLYEEECNMGTLPAAGRIFHDEVQLDWGSFAWKAFKAEIKKFFKRKGISEDKLNPFEERKEYGVVYIDE